jgi:hypothetical protein
MRDSKRKQYQENAAGARLPKQTFPLGCEWLVCVSKQAVRAAAVEWTLADWQSVPRRCNLLLAQHRPKRQSVRLRVWLADCSTSTVVVATTVLANVNLDRSFAQILPPLLHICKVRVGVSLGANDARCQPRGIPADRTISRLCSSHLCVFNFSPLADSLAAALSQPPSLLPAPLHLQLPPSPLSRPPSRLDLLTPRPKLAAE